MSAEREQEIRRMLARSEATGNGNTHHARRTRYLLALLDSERNRNQQLEEAGDKLAVILRPFDIEAEWGITEQEWRERLALTRRIGLPADAEPAIPRFDPAAARAREQAQAEALAGWGKARGRADTTKDNTT